MDYKAKVISFPKRTEMDDRKGESLAFREPIYSEKFALTGDNNNNRSVSVNYFSDKIHCGEKFEGGPVVTWF